MLASWFGVRLGFFILLSKLSESVGFLYFLGCGVVSLQDRSFEDVRYLCEFEFDFEVDHCYMNKLCRIEALAFVERTEKMEYGYGIAGVKHWRQLGLISGNRFRNID